MKLTHLVALNNCPVIFQSRQHDQPPLLVIGELSDCMSLRVVRTNWDTQQLQGGVTWI